MTTSELNEDSEPPAKVPLTKSVIIGKPKVYSFSAENVNAVKERYKLLAKKCQGPISKVVKPPPSPHPPVEVEVVNAPVINKREREEDGLSAESIVKKIHSSYPIPGWHWIREIVTWAYRINLTFNPGQVNPWETVKGKLVHKRQSILKIDFDSGSNYIFLNDILRDHAVKYRKNLMPPVFPPTESYEVPEEENLIAIKVETTKFPVPTAPGIFKVTGLGHNKSTFNLSNGKMIFLMTSKNWPITNFFSHVSLFAKYDAAESDDEVTLYLYWKHNQGESINVDFTSSGFDIALRTFIEPWLTSFFQFTLDKQIDFLDSTNESLSTRADDLKVTLRDYQKRNLSWMLQVEDLEGSYPSGMVLRNRRILKLGKTRYCFQYNEVIHGLNYNPSSKPVFMKYDEMTLTRSSVRIRGGILADETGTGKTFTMLSLIHANPLKDVSEVMQAKSDNCYLLYYVPSRATLIVCPPNLIRQWYDESQRLYGFGKKRVILIRTVCDYYHLTWNDFIRADLVILSYNFLYNENYVERVSEFIDAVKSTFKGSRSAFMRHYENDYNFEMKTMIQRGDFLNTTGVYLHGIHWHRVVFDEIHERPSISKNLVASWYWGLTGTPSSKTIAGISAMSRWLNIPDLVAPDAVMFAKKFVRRNRPNLELPPLTSEVIFVELTPSELALIVTKTSESGIRETLMMCSHHSITMDKSDDGVLSPEQVCLVVQRKRCVEVQELVRSISMRERQLARLQSSPFPDEEEIVSVKETVKKETKRIEVVKSQYAFFERMLSAISVQGDGQNESDVCVICLDSLGKAQGEEGNSIISITRCGHAYCQSCISDYLARSSSFINCPVCKTSLDTRTDIFNMKRGAMKKSAADNAKGTNEIDYSIYGSKLQKLVLFLYETIKADPSHRIILFSQFSRLSDLISRALSEFHVSNVRVEGNIQSRLKAIREFKESRHIKVIMLDAESSASGLNLIEATHVVLVHPFYYENELDALSAEKQGIARAYRMGLTHPLKVVRFITKGTIEEEFYNQRVGKLKFGVDTFV